MKYIPRTFNGALMADTELYQLLAVLNLKNGSHNSVSKEISKLLGKQVDTYNMRFKAGEFALFIAEIKNALTLRG